MYSLEVKDIIMKYDNFTALSYVSLKVKKGEFLTLLGPSGCGKTTLLKIISGFIEPSNGNIFINQVDVTKTQPETRNTAMCFQSYALFPHLTVMQNLSFGLIQRNVDIKKREQILDEVVTQLELTSELKKLPNQLSGGQQQRVALGRALVMRPEVILFDEPLSNLDAKLRHKMRAEMKKLHKKVGTTTIYVTHDQIEAMTLADRIVIMKDGLIEQVGTPDEVYRRPNNIFVASFIGTPAMNFIEGKVSNVSKASSMIMLEDQKSIKLKGNNFYNNQNIILGLRPEDITVTSKKSVKSHNIIELDAEISVIEPMGHETVVICDSNYGELTGKVESNSKLKENMTVKINVSLEKVYLFDKKSEKNLNL